MTTRDLTAQPTPHNLPVIAPFWMDLTFAIPCAGRAVLPDGRQARARASL